jgi:LmbE family N-acetylglucosaminyl deacetylase
MTKILAVGAHPDDVEFGCVPLLIQEIQNGNHVRILVLSKGEAGSNGTPEERAQESRDAAKLIGAEVEFVDLGGDCHIRQSPENAIAIARELRRYKPDIVLAPNLDENQHPDHAAVAKMVRDASRLARYGGLVDLLDHPVHQIRNLYFYSITQVFTAPPDLIIDVSDVVPQWDAAMACHKTQMKTRAYPKLSHARARAAGAAIGVTAAIGLWTGDPIRVGALSDLTLSSRLY